MFEFGRIFVRLKSFVEVAVPDADAQLFIERACSALLPNADFRNTNELSKLASHFVAMADKRWLTVGRRPEPLAAAAVALAAEALEATSLKNPELTKRTADALHTSGRTVLQRKKELLATILTVARELPWGDTIDQTNIWHSTSEIVDYFVGTQKAAWDQKSGGTLEDKAEPPSFAKSVADRELLRTKVRGAATLLDGIGGASSSASLRTMDLDDLLIQKLLLHGFSEEEIVEKGPNALEALIRGPLGSQDDKTGELLSSEELDPMCDEEAALYIKETQSRVSSKSSDSNPSE